MIEIEHKKASNQWLLAFIYFLFFLFGLVPNMYKVSPIGIASVKGVTVYVPT